MKVVKGLLICVVLFGLMAMAGYVETHYTRTAEVIEVVENEVTVEDTCGFTWKFYGNKFREGQTVKMKMNTNHTDSIVSDDIILDVKIK